MRNILLLVTATGALAACGSEANVAQYGDQPTLPKQEAGLLPSMAIAEPTGWDGTVPKVPAGYTVTPLATDLKIPRQTLVLPNGDVLVAEDGSMVLVKAAPQPVLEVRACAEHGSPFDLVRAAYHLGNRHVPLALQPDHLTLEPDHVLADMLRAMHLIVHAVEEPFEPEGGAYSAGGHGHGHGHAHADEHDHNHNHNHDHAHDN